MIDIVDEAAHRCETRECVCIKPMMDIFFDSLRPPSKDQMQRIFELEKPIVGE